MTLLRQLLCLALVSLPLSSIAHSADLNADIVILSGSEAGFTAAIQAARMNHSVVLIEPTGHAGGMAVEGIAGDIKHGSEAVVSGIAREFYQHVAEHYGRPDPFTRSRWQPSYEPHVAEKVIEAMLAEHAGRITIVRGQRLREGSAGVEKQAQRIEAVVLEDGTRISGKVFIDASIEGHLLHFAGITTATGRESVATYDESLNGIQAESHHRNFTIRVDPYVEPGNPASGLIATIQPGELGEAGAADPHVMGFCFRLTLTRDPANLVPITRPENYQAANYEIYRRYLAAGGSLFAPHARLPAGKTDLGSWHDLSANLYGENVTYPAGSYAEQDRVVKHHRDFTQGLIWFLQHDPSVPERTRNRWQGWGLCRDEYTDNGHWNRRLYIRSARRMVSDFVHTQHHTQWPNPKPVADPVAMAWWPPDMHHARRIVRNGAAYNEGFVYGNGGWSPFGISYRSLVPKRSQATNLLTPTCPSSSYVAYGAIRILPTFMMLGQSTGTAAALAIDHQADVQDVLYPALRSRLLADGLALSIPADAEWDGKRAINYQNESQVAESGPAQVACKVGATRCKGRFKITSLPEQLEQPGAELWLVTRGNERQPGRAWQLTIDKPATVFLLVMDRGETTLPDWDRVDGTFVEWATADGKPFRDLIYHRKVEAGKLSIPAHTGRDDGWHAIPNAAVVIYD